MIFASWWSPATDAGALVRVLVTIVIGAVLAVLFRRERALVLLIVGLTLVTLGWYGLRSLH